MHWKDWKTLGIDAKQHVQVVVFFFSCFSACLLHLRSCRWEIADNKGSNVPFVMTHRCSSEWRREAKAAEGQTTLMRRTAKNPLWPSLAPPTSLHHPTPVLWPPVAGAKLSCRLLHPPPRPLYQHPSLSTKPHLPCQDQPFASPTHLNLTSLQSIPISTFYMYSNLSKHNLLFISSTGDV